MTSSGEVKDTYVHVWIFSVSRKHQSPAVSLWMWKSVPARFVDGLIKTVVWKLHQGCESPQHFEPRAQLELKFQTTILKLSSLVRFFELKMIFPWLDFMNSELFSKQVFFYKPGSVSHKAHTDGIIHTAMEAQYNVNGWNEKSHNWYQTWNERIWYLSLLTLLIR